MPRLFAFALLLLLAACNSGSDDPDNPTPTPTEPPCEVSSTTTSETCIEIVGDSLIIRSNGLPNHATGTFPNMGNPHTISAQSFRYAFPVSPDTNATPTALYNETQPAPMGQFSWYQFGAAINGLPLDPIAAEFFENPMTMDLNREWNLEATFAGNNLGLDFNDAHVQPSGAYHYHGRPDSLLNEDGSKFSSLYGYAADGFPVYYKYVYQDPLDSNSSIVSVSSGWQLKAGGRPGDGNTAPSGPHNGRYRQDYEFVGGTALDQCNGRWGYTPEYPNGTYYYVITDNWPYIPNCFKGTPQAAFGRGSGGTPMPPNSPFGKRP